MGETIRTLREGKGLTLKEVKPAGKSVSWLWRVERGEIKDISTRDAIAIAQKLGVKLSEIVGDSRADELAVPEEVLPQAPQVDEETQRLAEVGRQVLKVVQEEALSLLVPRERVEYVEEEPFEEMVELPILDSLAASQLGSSGRQVEETIAVPKRIADRARDPRVVRIAGDCLALRGLITGDHIVIDCANTEPREGQIVAFRFKGEEAVKVYHQDGNVIELRPTVPKYPTITVQPHEVTDLDVIGVMVGAMLTAPRE